MPNSSIATEIEGSCHCGAIEVSLSFSKPPDQILPRACQCDFCTRQSCLWVSDPNGASQIRITQRDALNRYRFGHETADFLICSQCGTSVAAVVGEGEDMKLVANARGLAMTMLCEIPLKLTDFDAEDPSGRMARRQRNWTPATLQITV